MGARGMTPHVKVSIVLQIDTTCNFTRGLKIHDFATDCISTMKLRQGSEKVQVFLSGRIRVHRVKSSNQAACLVVRYKFAVGATVSQLKPGSKASLEVPRQNQEKTLQHSGRPWQTGAIGCHLCWETSSKLSMQPFRTRRFSQSAVSRTSACQRHIGLPLLRGLRGLPVLVFRNIRESTHLDEGTATDASPCRQTNQTNLPNLTLSRL